jgi:hypothetical protein
MRRHSVRTALNVSFVATAALGHAGQAAPKPKAAPPAAPHHIALAPGDLKWGPAPPVLPAGAQVAVLDGDPFKPGFFAIRLKMPRGRRDRGSPTT